MSRYDPPPPHRTGTAVSADGTRVAYEEHGLPDGPTVVLSHGWTCSTRFWAAVIRELAPHARVVAYDQRGHGASDIPRERARYSTEALADDLEAVLRAVVPAGGRAVLAGHSMGGMTLMAAAGRPDVAARTAAALLVSTGSSQLVAKTVVLPSRIRNVRLRRAFHRYLLRSAAPLGPRGPLLRAALKYGVMARGSTREQADVTTRIVLACDRRARARWGRVLAGLDLDAGLARLTAPTAILVGTADKLTPPGHAARMAALLPHCLGVIELPGLGHMTPLEDPDAVARAIRDLVDAHLARPATAPGDSVPEQAGHQVKEGDTA
jgi:pimeloyl-ACP methyl ester carboxylesterase